MTEDRSGCNGIPGLKFCTKCKIDKPFSEFNKRKSTLDGFEWHCRECVKAANKKLGKTIKVCLKICSKCGVEKSSEYFHNNAISRDGLSNICKECKHKYDVAYVKKNHERFRQRSIEYGRKARICNKLIADFTRKVVTSKKCTLCGGTKSISEFYNSVSSSDGVSPWCKKCKSERDKIYREKNKEVILLKKKKYRESNMPKILEYMASRRNSNIQVKIAENLRNRLKKAIVNKRKHGSAVRDLGCSLKDFMVYLESLFFVCPKTGEKMTWENYGSKWVIDHWVPLSSFDLTDKEQLFKACNWSNLRPMWSYINESKLAILPNELFNEVSSIIPKNFWNKQFLTGIEKVS